MDLIESGTHAFIVRVWMEETEEEVGKAVWRGHITHVGSHERQYFQTLDDIPTILTPYLEDMGVKLSLVWRVRRWLRRRGRR